MGVFTASNVAFMLQGLLNTIVISAASIVLSIAFGTLLALAKSYCRGRWSWLRWLVTAYIELFRCTPNLLWILIFRFTVQGDNILVSILTFTVFTSAVMAEIVRGGLNALPKGQFEAAQSQGFGFVDTMRLIVLPQAFKMIVPALFSQCTTVIKDTSYLRGIDVHEFMRNSAVVMGQASTLPQILLLYGFVLLTYFVLNFAISLAVRAYQRRNAAA
ncbi:amino acid ABC transporter permease [Parafannyhessea umbonata]|jgi:putative glutamine transport system permease protein|uniref:Amino acid ABC transporter permease n=1 Tax=Parafannyhessea umbonata TaxID=604330 RepID=A0A6N7X9F6_9ACTN|nr:amino acid ABC transporter permease [Parafannyhessea umbonata]MCI6682479.1 amino acid ABC transporter permease [Parafannyhessea umbonata]MCI7219273.1 amino acid ABC transporter permease [Parafannyhessea umbonata]MDD6358415.1 amino acid ABC transporter permease [Parafannyhessea umbonata]MDD6565273.1 amino acid ABC transporter permease [Parafannyhessea umbonata]MDD6602093.1 amino acid ABC transporter permease [Parafannyhessea umbonata]